MILSVLRKLMNCYNMPIAIKKFDTLTHLSIELIEY